MPLEAETNNNSFTLWSVIRYQISQIHIYQMYAAPDTPKCLHIAVFRDNILSDIILYDISLIYSSFTHHHCSLYSDPTGSMVVK